MAERETSTRRCAEAPPPVYTYYLFCMFMVLLPPVSSAVAGRPCCLEVGVELVVCWSLSAFL